MVMDNKQNIIYQSRFPMLLRNCEKRPLRYEHNIERKNNIWTSLHFQCDTFFIHTLKLLVHILTKTDTTYF